MTEEKLIFEISKPGKSAVSLDECVSDPFGAECPPALRRAVDLGLPQVSEPELIRHYFRLSQKNFSVDTHFYPLGSCTMKYNPKINEELARLSGFELVHPLFPTENVQGILQLMAELEEYLAELTGMHSFTLQPAAGAHGELTGMMLVKAYHAARGEAQRVKVIVPDSSHGTNPASAGIYGFEIVEIESNERGRVTIDALRNAAAEDCACLMLTNPNTLGLFEDDILEIADVVHEKGGLLYYDGANMNALMGLCRPGDMGFDIVHLNLHKTFSTPHGGGGPGAGPVGVCEKLAPFLPVPRIRKTESGCDFDNDRPESIGKIKSFYGNVGVLVKAYCYIRIMGLEGLRQASRDAIITANYLRTQIGSFFPIPYNDICMHEFVASAEMLREVDIHAADIAKRLLDFGFHAPTVSFPLIVKEALMIEPTETESKMTLDAFAEALRVIYQEARDNPEHVKNAPHSLPINRCDEVKAARNPDLCFHAPSCEKENIPVSR